MEGAERNGRTERSEQDDCLEWASRASVKGDARRVHCRSASTPVLRPHLDPPLCVYVNRVSGLATPRVAQARIALVQRIHCHQSTASAPNVTPESESPGGTRRIPSTLDGYWHYMGSFHSRLLFRSMAMCLGSLKYFYAASIRISIISGERLWIAHYRRLVERLTGIVEQCRLARRH